MNEIDIADLYQELIVDHSRRPRNYRELRDATHKAEGYNPLCGDRVTVYLNLDDQVVRDVAFEGDGCAISKASASLMTENIKGKTRAEIEQIFTSFHDLATGRDGSRAASLGKLAVFSGIREFPARVKCATLAWHTLRAAFENRVGVVSTE